MNETRKTIVFLAVALVLAVAAYLAVPTAQPPELFSDEGEFFYPPFDPLEAASVTVATFPEDKSAPEVFKVELRGGKWTIPSHEGYPADAEDQLAETAAVVNGLQKGAIRSDREKDFAVCGVVDPLDEDRASSTGRGKRVILKDGTGRLLSDLIIGAPVEGRPGARYVRRPDSKRVYACAIEASNISTRFADWVDTDLLKLRKSDIRLAVLDRYRVDQDNGVMVPGDRIVLERGGSEWKMPDLGEDEEFVKSKADTMADAMADMTLVGVRRKPQGLLDLLDKIKGGNRISPSELFKIRDLSSVGFHLVETEDGQGYRVVSRDGELRVETDKGVVYTLRFGDILYGEPDAISGAAEADPGEDSGDAEGAEHRYLFVTASFDEALLGPKPEPPAKPEGLEEKAEGEDAGEEEDGAAGEEGGDDPLAEYEKAREKYERDLSAYEKKAREGREKAEELQDRFEEWYYVISADVFEKLHLSREDLVREKEKEEETAEDEQAQQPEAPEGSPVAE